MGDEKLPSRNIRKVLVDVAAVVALPVSLVALAFTGGQAYTAYKTYRLTTTPLLFLSCRKDNLKAPTIDEREHVVALLPNGNEPGFRFLDFTNPVVGPSGRYVRLPFEVARCALSNQGQIPLLRESVEFKTKPGELPREAPFPNTVQVAFGALSPGGAINFLVANLNMTPIWIGSPSSASVETPQETAAYVPLYRDDGAATLDLTTMSAPVSCYEPGPGAFHLPGTFHAVIGRSDCAKDDGVDANQFGKTFTH
jgi:hypothetical protein